jgi:hypothetical protein
MTSAASISSFCNLVPGQMTVSEQALLLSALESALQGIVDLKVVVQSLRDVKGEDGKPTISGKHQKSVSLDQRKVSSETARKTVGDPSVSPR